MLFQLPSLEVFLNACLIATLFTLTIRIFTPALFEEELNNDQEEPRIKEKIFPIDPQNEILPHQKTEASPYEDFGQINFRIPPQIMEEIKEMSPDYDAKKGLEEAYHLWVYVQRQKKQGYELGLYHRPNGSIHLIDFRKTESISTQNVTPFKNNEDSVLKKAA